MSLSAVALPAGYLLVRGLGLPRIPKRMNRISHVRFYQSRLGLPAISFTMSVLHQFAQTRRRFRQFPHYQFRHHLPALFVEPGKSSWF